MRVSTVLVLQGDTELGEVWRVTLESSGHTVVGVAAATAGAHQVRSGGIDVVVVDGTGDELGDLVEELEHLPDAPPLVLVSASPDAPVVSARIGAAAFLLKPCSPGELDAVVGRLVGDTPRTQMDDDPTTPHHVLPEEPTRARTIGGRRRR